MDEQEQENQEQRKETIKLNDKQIKIMLLLDQAPNNLKNIYYVVGNTNSNYSSVLREIKTLEAIGLISEHRSSLTGKVFYIPKQEVIDAIKEKQKEGV